MRKARIIGCVIALIAIPLAHAGSVRVFHDPDADFTSYRTYEWAEAAPAQIPELRQYLTRRIDERLEAAGLQRVERDADLAVAIFVASDTTGGLVGGYYDVVSWDIAMFSTRVSASTKAELFVDLIDVSTNRAVWHGESSARLNHGEYGKARKKIDKAVRKLFRDFPPVDGQ